MELRHLRAFKEVVERRSFSRAARALDSTQSTVSKAVAQLEHDCGLPLWEGSGAGRRLTAAGGTVYQRALAMVREQEGLISDLADIRGGRKGRLGLGIPPLGSGALFAEAMAVYRRQYPGIEIHLREEGGRRLEKAIQEGDLELGITLPPIPGDFEGREIVREPLMALLPPGFVWSGGNAIRLKRLAQEPFILFEEGFALNSLITAVCRQRGFLPREVARSGQADFIIAMVAAGVGVGFLPQLVVRGQRRLPVRAVVLDEPELKWAATLIWRRDRPLSPAARAWRDLILERRTK